jgi:uncharacterized heparinase superfamily protein
LTKKQVPTLADRFHAWRAGKCAVATGLVGQPEPLSIGSYRKGRQIVAGKLMFAGELIEAPDISLWDVEMPSADFSSEAHGFLWLDDLAAAGDTNARDLARRWLSEWVAKYPSPSRPPWSPEVTGRRVIRWVNNALFILQGSSAHISDDYYKSLSKQTEFLARRWRVLPSGLGRSEALVGIIYAGLTVEGMQHHVDSAMKALASDCDAYIDAQGGIASRNPEELLDVLTHLTWVQKACADVGREPATAISNAVERIGPTLRALRHANGGLTRFHGGGRGVDGKLDQALANAASRVVRAGDTSMGFARLNGGRTSLIVDASLPPITTNARRAHASTLAMELTSGRRPLIVNCGAGVSFGDRWARAGRATPSHSVLHLEGLSSAQLNDEGHLVGGPQTVQLDIQHAIESQKLGAAHDAWARSHGLTYVRELELSADGRVLSGSDMLTTMNDADKNRFDLALDATSLQGISYSVRFHLHAEVDASLDMAGRAVSLVLRSGETWVFRASEGVQLSLEPSVYLEKGRIAPRATMQIVLSGKAVAYASQVKWSLSKAQDTPLAVRDLFNSDDLPDWND